MRLRLNLKEIEILEKAAKKAKTTKCVLIKNILREKKVI